MAKALVRQCIFTRGAWIEGARDAARMRYQCERMITRSVKALPEVASCTLTKSSLSVTFTEGVPAERAQELMDTSITDTILKAACSKKAFPDVMRRNGRPTLKQPSVYTDEFGAFLCNIWLEFMVITSDLESGVVLLTDL